MKNKILIPIISMVLFSLILTGLVSAQEQSWGSVKGGDCIELTNPCDNCTYNNITSIVYPNKTSYALRGEYSMTKFGTDFNYTFCDTTALGIYFVNGHGDLDGTDKIWSADFESTTTGRLSNNVIPIFLLISGIILLVLGIVIKNPAIGFFSGVLLIMVGMYLMIYGFGDIADLYTQAFALVILGFGILISILAGFSWLEHDE